MIPQETPPSPRRAEARRRAARSSLTARISSWFSSRPRAVLTGAAGVVIVALATGSVVAGAAVGRPPVASVAAPELDATEARVMPELPAGAVRARTCAVDTADPAFGTLAASVVNASTGERLFSRGQDESTTSLALHKLHTAAVALQVLGPDTRLATRVYEGSVEGSVVIVGGGDPTLSALPDGVESVYPGAPRVSDLAAQTKASLDKLYPGTRDRGDWRDWRGRDDDDDDEVDESERRRLWDLLVREAPKPDWEVTEIVVDAGLWGFGDMWDAGWPTTELAAGTQANIVPLMVDGDRQDPAVVTSPRSGDPVAAATTAFITALDLSSPKIIYGEVLSDRPLLAEVYSQPISVLVQQMLQLNDNTLADMLARLSSTAIGGDGSAASLQQVYEAMLVEYELPADGIVVMDGSGLNLQTTSRAEQTSRLLALVATGHPTLQPLQAGLSVPGVSGSLLHRFGGGLSEMQPAFAGVGSTTDAATSLGGILTAADGSVLAVSLQSTGPVTSSTSLALESLVAEIHECGDNLSNVVGTSRP